MFNLQKMMQQAEKMQNDMKSIQKEMENTRFSGSAGGELVVITCNGKFEFLSVKINPEACENREMLEDLLLAALKDLSGKVSGTMEEKMSSVTAGLNIPGLKLPF